MIAFPCDMFTWFFFLKHFSVFIVVLVTKLWRRSSYRQTIWHTKKEIKNKLDESMINVEKHENKDIEEIATIFEYQLFLADSILKYQILIVRQPKKHVYMSSIFSLSNAGRIQTSEYKITFLEFGCLSSAYCNCAWLFIVFWVVIIWIIHSWFWFVE